VRKYNIVLDQADLNFLNADVSAEEWVPCSIITDYGNPELETQFDGAGAYTFPARPFIFSTLANSLHCSFKNTFFYHFFSLCRVNAHSRMFGRLPVQGCCGIAFVLH
jgi:hypothetical protein